MSDGGKEKEGVALEVFSAVEDAIERGKRKVLIFFYFFL